MDRQEFLSAPVSAREKEMTRTAKTLGAAAIFAAIASIASAAPATMGHVPDGLSNGLIQVHGNHRSCQRGPGGWHRHNRFGERRQCREWDGRGRRPDACVRVGPIWYCDHSSSSCFFQVSNTVAII